MADRWTLPTIQALGPVMTVPTLSAIVDCSDETIYALIRRGEWTATRVLRLGRKIRIPTRDVIVLLYGVAALTADAPTDPHVPSPCQLAEKQQVKAVEPHASCGCTPVSDALRPRRESERDDAPWLRPPSRPEH